jgi:hypothetical protein
VGDRPRFRFHSHAGERRSTIDFGFTGLDKAPDARRETEFLLSISIIAHLTEFPPKIFRVVIAQGLLRLPFFRKMEILPALAGQPRAAQVPPRAARAGS